MTLLNVSRLAKYYGADLIFSHVTFQVSRGEKVALVGVNGAGKSTLIRIIAGREEPDDGEVQVARGLRVAYLAQEEHFGGDRTLWAEMEAALGHLSRLQKQISSLEQHLHDTDDPDWEERMARYGDLQAQFEHAGGYHVEQTIKRTLHGLGFLEAQYYQPLSQFSGGQKTRAALAATLLSSPDLLLLDEPTNHLDLEAMEWLDGFLKSWPATLLVISHDRHFLDQVTQRTLDMEFGGLEDYPAGYSRYLELKADRLQARTKQYETQQEFIARTEEFIRRYGAGQRSKEAHGREKRLDRLKEQSLIHRPRQTDKLRLFLDRELRSGELVLTFDNLEIGYPNGNHVGEAAAPEVLLSVDGLELHRGERIALIGPNGSGKTTLLRTLMGELRPGRGRFRFGHKVSIGYYAQAHEGLDPDATVLQEVLDADSDLTLPRARTLLGRFLFSGDDVFKRVRDLSGGERSRVALARLTLLPTSLLVMDEPTNHLDIDAREALEAVLTEYKGSLLFVSHDRYLIDALADKLWVVRDGRLVEFSGNYSEYVAALEKERQAARDERAQTVSLRKKREDRSVSPTEQAAREEKRRQKRLAEIEAAVAALEEDLAALKTALEAASVAQDVEQVTSLGQQYVALEQRRDRLYEDWEEVISPL